MTEKSAQVNSHNTESTTEVSHETTIFAEPIFHIGNFTVTNALINSWVTVFILVTAFILIGRKIKKAPRGLQNIFEIILEEGMNLTDSVTGSRHKTEKFLPLALALFLFILVNNWLGLLPGIGTIGFIETEEGHSTFVPFFRGATADLNLTLALSLFAVVLSHVLGVMSLGLWKHFNKFFNIEILWQTVKKFTKEPMLLMVNPIKFFVGIIEAVGEVAKIASLSLRLFGNIFAGEVLLASMMAISAYILPVPFMFMELIVGMVQALVFSILTLAFISIATSAEEH